MKINITALIFVLGLTITSTFADELTNELVAKRKIQTQPVVMQQEYIEPEIPQEILPPVFTPYQPNKNEVVFSYTKNWINAVDPTAQSNKSGSYLPGARGINQLIIYTPSYGERTNTNEFGAEAEQPRQNHNHGSARFEFGTAQFPLHSADEPR